MTREDKEAILNSFDETMIQPDEAMNLTEMRAYVKGFEDARNAMFDVTGCENRELIFEGTPEENGYKFCHYCGRKIKRGGVD